MDKYLIVGLGNPGDEYAETRHNAGYMVLDAFAKASNIVFDDKRYGYVAETSIKGRKVFLLKPTTFMNLSGNAVRYWLGKENIDQSRLLVVSDEVAVPLGQFRLKARTTPACAWASATTSRRACRFSMCSDTSPPRSASCYSPPSTSPSTSSAASCLQASTSP